MSRLKSLIIEKRLWLVSLIICAIIVGMAMISIAASGSLSSDKDSARFTPLTTDYTPPEDCQPGEPSKPIEAGYRFRKSLFEVDPGLLAKELALSVHDNENFSLQDGTRVTSYIETFQSNDNQYIWDGEHVYIVTIPNKAEGFFETFLVRTCDSIDVDSVKSKQLWKLDQYVFAVYANYEEGIFNIPSLTSFQKVKTTSDLEQVDTKYLVLGNYDKNYPIPTLLSPQPYQDISHYREATVNALFSDMMNQFFSSGYDEK